MLTGFLHTHLLSVILFLVLYLIKTYLLLANKNASLAKFTKKTKVAEMIISTLFIATGIALIWNMPEISVWLYLKVAVVFASIPLAIIGFRKNNKPFAIISFIMLIGAYGLAEYNKKHPAKKDLVEAANAGESVYKTYCVTCHGLNGDAGINGAKNLQATVLSDEDVLNRIANGKGLMNGYKHNLTSDQIKSVADYIKVLRK